MKLVTPLLAALGFLSVTLPVAAVSPAPYQPIPGVSPEPMAERAGLGSKEDLEAFLDGVMLAQMRAQNTAGAIITVVKDGEIVLAKGYGYADVEKGIPVDPDRTLFRPGSVSKIFTWTALMQLVEQGKVGLDDDVNKYLTQFQIPDTYPGQPITVRHLLTHTEGMEDGGFGYLIVKSAEQLEDPAETLAKHLPARVRAPASGDFSNGDMSSYSNWGTSLAGLIVANVSGMSYEDYIDEFILKPLDMGNSTARQPLPAELAPNMSVGYTYEAAQFKPHDFEYINFAAAGSMSATAVDMGKFMIAHLQKGAYGDQRILREDTATLMQARALSLNPHTNGACLGFYENHVNGRRLIVHGGDTMYFHSEMNLLPAENVGIFVSLNSAASFPFPARSHLLREFMNRYFPAQLPAVEPPADFAERAAKYAGSYRIIRHSYTSFEKLFALGSVATVSPTDRNTLLLNFGPYTFDLVEVAPDVFRHARQDDMVAFSIGEDGKASYLLNPLSLPNHTAYRIGAHETPMALGLMAGFAILCFVVAVVSALRNWRQDGRSLDTGPRRARRWAALTAAVHIAFLGYLGYLVMLISKDPFGEFLGGLKIALVLPLAALALTVPLLWFLQRAWREGWWSLYGRMQFSIIVAGMLTAAWLLHYSNLIGWQIG
jgi:CubicO group peptidase (beta-lactamase class C family)